MPGELQHTEELHTEHQTRIIYHSLNSYFVSVKQHEQPICVLDYTEYLLVFSRMLKPSIDRSIDWLIDWLTGTCQCQ